MEKEKINIQKRAELEYEKLQFRDDFLFCKILTERPDIAKAVVELILGEPVKNVVPQRQKAIEITDSGRGIRLDVYLDDCDETVYDLEMQTTLQRDLPKRSRYYQGMIDLDMISRGDPFSKLKQSFVIFICTEDPFALGRHVYSFENICREEEGLLLLDGTHKIFVNANGWRDDISDQLKDFLNLVSQGSGETTLSKMIESEVKKARQSKKWRLEYMTLYMRDEEKRAEGRAEGRAEERRNMIEALLRKGEGKDFICSLGISEEELLEVEKSMSSMV